MEETNDGVDVDSHPARYAFLIIGIPGSGKTTVAHAMAQRFALAAEVDDEVLADMIVASGHLPTTNVDKEASRRSCCGLGMRPS
ncbi:MAG: hypothetical protein ACRENX_03705 [Candidatus Dormibacteria bacterium]